jgi:hypothetical protein
MILRAPRKIKNTLTNNIKLISFQTDFFIVFSVVIIFFEEFYLLEYILV